MPRHDQQQLLQAAANDVTGAEGGAAAAVNVNPLSAETVKLLEATGLFIDRDLLMQLDEIGSGKQTGFLFSEIKVS